MARLTREQKQALTREKLLLSALDVVARDGYDGASVERIAEEAGFSKGAFYSNFSSKEEILLELLEGNAGHDVEELSELLREVTDPDEVIEVVARWCDSRASEQKWGIIAIEFLRRAQRDGTLSDRHRQLFVSQWEQAGALLQSKLLPGHEPGISALDLGGIVLELTYGGISSFLKANTSGQMIRHVLNALRNSVRVTH
ncbi:TetR/AcrR family transcriptional regulator [Nonomuraea sp. H19]|jgi:AcrR family transcriptional regulator|uniref:TetR/AcrR family transcriptional regulator n=1 Tax=Nonomuraea sp. H19 TaxID=3452206 RepID=UPI003F895B2F